MRRSRDLADVRAALVLRTLLCFVVMLVVLRLLGPEWRSGFPATFPDTSSYFDVASQGPFTAGFWWAQRPPTYPLMVWLLGSHAPSIVLTQALIAIAAWAWLCSTVWTMMRSRAVAVGAIFVLLLIAIQTRWIFWHTALLTESLSASLAVAGVAAWWRWFDEPSRFRTVAAVALTGSWMLLRDSNAVTMLVCVVPAMFVVALMDRQRPSVRRRRMTFALAALVMTGAYSLAVQVSTDRGETSFHNNVGLRWLPDDEMRAFFVGHGMPVSPALEARAGSDAWADGEAFLSDPALGEYRAWAADGGRRAAALSAIVESDWYLDHLWDGLPLYTSTDHLSYDTFEISRNFPERPLDPIDPAGSRWAMCLWMAGALVALGVAWTLRRTTAWFVALLVVPVLVDLYLVFVGDAIEVGRHLVGPMMRWSVVCVVCVAVGIDLLLDDRLDDRRSDA